MTMEAESEDVRRLLTRASEEAAAIGNDYIGATHLLLAMVADETSPAARLLENEGVQPANLRERLLEQLERRERIDPKHVTDLTPRARAGIRHADAQAARHDVPNTRDVDVLVGLLAQQESVASRVLGQAGLTYDALHRAVYAPDAGSA
jgi:ATP-dependent Clp protease ATP-binding subunit ClpA